MLVDRLNSKISSGYKLYGYENVKIDVGSIAANSFSGKKSGTFTKISGATYFIPVQIEGGWLTCTYSTISGNTLTVEFANWSNATHSGGGTFVVLQFGPF